MKHCRVTTKFGQWNVQTNRQNEVQFLSGLGNMDAGTLIWVEEFVSEHPYPDFYRVPNSTEYFVCAKSQYEAEARNHGGGIGAFRDIPNQKRVDEIIAKLEAEYNLTEVATA